MSPVAAGRFLVAWPCSQGMALRADVAAYSSMGERVHSPGSVSELPGLSPQTKGEAPDKQGQEGVGMRSCYQSLFLHGYVKLELFPNHALLAAPITPVVFVVRQAHNE